MPTLAIASVRPVGRRRLWVPIPLVLLWPFVGLLLAMAEVAKRARRWEPREAAALGATCTTLRAFFRLSGLKIDIQTRDRAAIHVTVI